jgi:hypothetical protein
MMLNWFEGLDLAASPSITDILAYALRILKE